MGGYVPSYYLVTQSLQVSRSYDLSPSPQVLAELIKQKALEVAQTPFPVLYEEELQRQISQEVHHGRMQPLPTSELEQVNLEINHSFMAQFKLFLAVLL